MTITATKIPVPAIAYENGKVKAASTAGAETVTLGALEYCVGEPGTWTTYPDGGLDFGTDKLPDGSAAISFRQTSTVNGITGLTKTTKAATVYKIDVPTGATSDNSALTVKVKDKDANAAVDYTDAMGNAYRAGAEFTLTATPEAGAYFNGFTDGTSDLTGVVNTGVTAASTYTFTVGSEAKTVAVKNPVFVNLLKTINTANDNGAAIMDALADTNFADVFGVSADSVNAYKALSNDTDKLAIAKRLEDHISRGGDTDYTVAELRDAFTSLVGLQTKLAEVDALDKTLYTKGSMDALTGVVKAATDGIDGATDVTLSTVDGWTAKVAAAKEALVTKALSVYVKVVGAPENTYVSGAISGVISGGTETTTNAKDSFYLSPQAGKTVTITVGTKTNYTASVKVDNVTTELPGNALTLTMGSASKNVVITYTYNGEGIAPGFKGGWPADVPGLPVAPRIDSTPDGKGGLVLTVTPVLSPALCDYPTQVVISLPGGGTAKLPMDVEPDGADGYKGVIKIPAGLLPSPLTGPVLVDPIPIIPAVVERDGTGVNTFITAINKKLENDLAINTETGVVTIKPDKENKYFPATVT